MPVFPEPTGPRDTPLGCAEPYVNFYLESTWPEAVTARKWINSAYERFPDPSGALADRLRSTDYVQHASALAELLVHERLSGRGLRVTYEEGGVGPDFRIYRDDAYLGAVEVCCLLDDRTLDKERQRHGQIADALNQRVPLDSWFARFDVIRLDRQPSVKALARWVRETIASLPTAVAPAGTFTPPFSYREDGVELRFQFLLRRSDTPPRPGDRLVGFGRSHLGFVASYKRIRSALAEKVRKRYNTRGKPLALFAVDWDIESGLDQYEDALHGNEQVRALSGTVRRVNNGFYGTRPERPAGKHTEVSCVFVLRNFRPWAPTDAPLLRFDNPFADSPFPDSLLPADHTLVATRIEGGFRLEWSPEPPSL